tara:strand:+ start:210 stop:497 length:288 start_codon:yes stop_codon:yes gene_type:complete
MNEDEYYYNNEPLQLSYRNNYTPQDKLNIVLQLERDYSSGMVSDAQVRFIVNNAKFGSFTIMKIIDKLLFEKKLKHNPITLDKRTFFKPKRPFDL